MSHETTITTPAADAGSTQAIAASTLETLEQDASDTAGDTAPALGDTAPPAGDTTPAATSPPVPGVVTPPLSEAEQLLAEAGVTEPRRHDGRENRIPYSKVKQIIENGLHKGKGEFGTKYKAAQDEITGYRETMSRTTPVFEALDQGPEAFAAYAAQKDPRWKAFLEARTAPPAAIPADLPEPDFALPDGSKTYSLKGIRESLVPWIVQQARTEAAAAAEAQYRPIAEREQAARAHGQLRSKVQSQLEKARTWEGFTAHEPAILAALQADTAHELTLHDAYIQVVIPALKADETKMREKLLAELKAAPTGTAVSRGGAETVSATAGTKTTADVAREVYAQLNRG